MNTTVVVVLGLYKNIYFFIVSNLTSSIGLLFNGDQNFMKYVVHLKVFCRSENEVREVPK